MDELPKGIYQLITWPNTILLEASKECTKEDIPELQKLLKPMDGIMRKYNGLGLAAVQIGVLKRFCILYAGKDDAYGNSKRKIVEMINPVIVKMGDIVQKMPEGCLSLPFLKEMVDRYVEVTVKYKDMAWRDQEITLTEVDAQCIQHEIAHMDGKPICLNLSVMKRQMWEKKVKKYGYHIR